jgi:hypothetical protein
MHDLMMLCLLLLLFWAPIEDTLIKPMFCSIQQEVNALQLFTFQVILYHELLITVFKYMTPDF